MSAEQMDPLFEGLNERLKELLKRNIVFIVEIDRAGKVENFDRGTTYIEGVYSSQELASDKVEYIVSRLGKEDCEKIADGCYKRDNLSIYTHYLLLNDDSNVIINRSKPVITLARLRKQKLSQSMAIYLVVQDQFGLEGEEEDSEGKLTHIRERRFDSFGEIRGAFTQEKKARAFVAKFISDFCGKEHWKYKSRDSWVSKDKFFRLYITMRVLDEHLDPYYHVNRNERILKEE